MQNVEPDHESAETLGAKQQILFQVIFDVFRASGEWPTYQHVDKTLEVERGLDIRGVLPTVPAGLLGPDPRNQHAVPQEHDRVGLTIEGLYRWGGAAPLLNLFVEVLRYLVDRERSFQPSSATIAEELSITSDEVLESLSPQHWGPGPRLDEVARVFTLLLSDPFVYRGAGGGPLGSRTITISPQIRRYREAFSIEQYLERRRDESSEAVGAPVRTQFGLTPQAPAVRRAFLLMPFVEELDWLRDLLISAGEAAGVLVERADDVFEAGVIIDQVKERIARADAVIAVCTGRNANVFYELGIADRVHRPILVAESSADLPFDVQHFRAHFYKDEAPKLVRERIARALLETIEARASG